LPLVNSVLNKVNESSSDNPIPFKNNENWSLAKCFRWWSAVSTSYMWRMHSGNDSSDNCRKKKNQNTVWIKQRLE
jgi:hypothetical protein